MGDRLVLLDRRRGATHVLNPSGSIVWAAMARGGSMADVVARVAAVVGLPGDQVAADVASTLADLVELGVAATDGPSAEPDLPAPSGPRAAPAQPSVSAVAVVVAAGTTVALGADDAGVRRDLESVTGSMPRAAHGRHRVEVTGPHGEPGTSREPIYGIVVDGRETYRVWSPGDAVDRALAAVNALAIAGTPDRVLLHGGAVERDGQVVVVVGPSGRGKSTTTAALVRAGFGYLTDELVVIDPGDLAVAPFAKAVDLGPESRELLDLPAPATAAKEPMPPSEMGRISEGGRLAAVVLLADERPEPVRLDPLDALLELLPNVFGETFERPEGLEDVAHLVGTVPVHRVGRAEPDRLVATISSLLG